jgi:endo-1,4-beta-xylanase
MKSLTRFFSLNGLTALFSLIFIIAGISSSMAQTTGLKDAAAKAYLNFGVATDRPSSYTSLITKDFNMLVCENAMKWTGTENTQGRFTYSGGDQVCTFAATNSMKMRGHTFVWHAQTPTWVQNLNRDQMLAAMRTHIDSVGGHFKGKILEWDVVNEAVSAGTSSFWQKTIGTGFIDTAFVYARKADPVAKLYYNDYGGEGTGGKGDQIYTMVKSMIDRKIPIDGVGFQCHFSNTVNKASISANMKRLGDLGLRVSCTEIDIQNTSTNGAPWTALMEACLENYNCTSFIVWGVDDAVSWRGSGCGCLIFDGSQQPKPAVYNALMTALNNADPTITEKRRVFINQLSGIKNGKGVMAEPKGKSAWFHFADNAFSFNLPSDRAISIRIVDMSGKSVADMNLGLQSSGTHTVPWTGRRFPVGLYFATVTAGDEKIVLKIAKTQ